MYDIQFVATNSAGWAQSIELIDSDTNLALDATDVSFEMDVRDECGRQMIEASTEAGNLERPEINVIQWRFAPDQMRGFCPGTTYRVGCTATDAGGTIQLFIGTLAFLDGAVS